MSMNTVVVDGKEYVKAKDLAKDLGYTTDYVGQLCRAEKVDAQLVGRSWYVNEESLREHKQSRYRSNQKETVREIKRTLEAKNLDEKEAFKVNVHEGQGSPEDVVKVGYAGERFYRRAEVPEVAKYHTDDAELFPQTNTVNKTGKLRVELAEAKDVKISSKSSAYDFNPGERPKLRFKGRLSITDIEESERLAEEEAAAEAAEKAALAAKSVSDAEALETEDVSESKSATEVRVAELEEKQPPLEGARIKVKHRRPSSKRRKRDLPMEHNTQGVLGMQRGTIVARNPKGGTLKVNTPSHSHPGVHLSSMTVVLTIFTGMVFGVLLSSLEKTVVVESGVVTVHYSLDIQNVLAAAYDPFRR